MFSIKKQLSEIGVLGLNRRNAEYTLQYNLRRLYPLVDDKLQTKILSLKAGIAVPELYGVVEAEYQVRQIEGMLKSYPDFVIKPSRGSGYRKSGNRCSNIELGYPASYRSPVL